MSLPSADKLADAKAKAAVREQILADKKARADKAAKEKALRDGTPLPQSTETTSTPVISKPTTAPGEKKVYDTTRLQIRLPGGGQPLVHSIAVGSTLSDLRSWCMDQSQLSGLTSVVFTSTFPR